MNSQAPVQAYMQHLLQGFESTPYGQGGWRIITPYWRPDGDAIEFFVLPDAEGLLRLSDEGQTFDWLFAVGLEAEPNSGRRALIERLAERCGVQLHHGDLQMVASADGLGEAIDRFLNLLREISLLALDRNRSQIEPSEE